MVSARSGTRLRRAPCMSTLSKVYLHLHPSSPSFSSPSFLLRFLLSKFGERHLPPSFLLLLLFFFALMYILVVVPTIYADSRGAVINTNQYSVTEYIQGIEQHSMSARGVPGKHPLYLRLPLHLSPSSSPFSSPFSVHLPLSRSLFPRKFVIFFLLFSFHSFLVALPLLLLLICPSYSSSTTLTLRPPLPPLHVITIIFLLS